MSGGPLVLLSDPKYLLGIVSGGRIGSGENHFMSVNNVVFAYLYIKYVVPTLPKDGTQWDRVVNYLCAHKLMEK